MIARTDRIAIGVEDGDRHRDDRVSTSPGRLHEVPSQVALVVVARSGAEQHGDRPG
jgi:hypothetical protein